VSASIIKNYDERSAKVLRQPAVINFIHSKMNEIGVELRNEPLVKTVNDQLTPLEKLVTFQPGKAPTLEEVRKVNQAVSKLIEEIQKKADAK
jgi:putative IMPACT (imprinted ancient) family translation regulator